MTLPSALAPLAQRRQFILCELRPNAKGKVDKVPLRWDLCIEHSAHDPTNWLTHEQAVALVEQWSPDASRRGCRLQVGFVFTETDPFFFLDIDDCVAADGQWDERARWAFATFPEAAIEISQSGRGLHVIGSYANAAPPHRKKDADRKMELYTAERFVALTANVPEGWQGSAAADCTAKLHALIAAAFEPREDTVPGWQEGPDARWSGPQDDAALVAFARTQQPPPDAAAAFGGATRGTFDDLWTGNLQPWGGDASRADYAMAFELAKLTGFDGPRIERIMRGSALVREKWDSHRQYLRELTIAAAVGAARVGVERQIAAGKPWPKGWWITEQPQPVQQQQAVLAAAPVQAGQWVDPAARWGHGELMTDAATQYMTGYRWIADDNEIVDPRGVRWDQPTFNNHHAGRSFKVRDKGAKAWDAAMVYVPHFARAGYDYTRPFLDEGHDEHGATTLNLAKLPVVPSKPGAVLPFFRHLKRLWPDKDKRRIFVYWATQAVQRRGSVIGWAPVVQGVPGNGKSSLIEMVQDAVGSAWEFDIHALVKAGSIGFNGFMADHVLMVANEPKLGESRDALNVLKPFVTDTWITVEWKGKDRKRIKNHLSWVVTTNYKNGIPIEPNERRWAPLFTAQQTREDIDKASTSAWWRWSKSTDARAAIAHWLQHARVVPEVSCDPTWDGTSAPITPDTVEAMKASRGAWEEEVVELIEQGDPGVRGGWVSSLAVQQQQPKIRAHSLHNVMEALGYVRHPALDGTDGRCTTISESSAPMCDRGRRPRLYVKRGHPALVIKDRAEVRTAYLEAQRSGADAPPKLVEVPRPEDVFRASIGPSSGPSDSPSVE